MRIYRGISARIALQMTEQMERQQLRAHVDAATGGEYDPWELDKLTQWTEEHPAYRALPEERVITYLPHQSRTGRIE